VTKDPKRAALWQSSPMATNRQRLISAAGRLLASRADAEDAVQDTYIRALVSFPDWRGAQPAWLHTVLRNIAIDRLRRKQLESEHADTELPPEGSLESLLEVRSECEAALRHLLVRVRPDEAAALLLCDVFEFDCDEIAHIIGKSNAASRQFLHRARTRAHRPDASSDVEEAYVGLCWRAIEARDPALLMDMLQVTIVASARQPAVTAGRDRRARSSSKLVQVNGRYAIALVLDGVVLCIVPVGTPATPMAESV
jgi:RNA polymerase sigma factor (sigma-70 family)